MANQNNRPIVAQYYNNTKDSPHKGFYRVLQVSQDQDGSWEAYCLSATEAFRIPVAVVRQHKVLRKVPSFYEWTAKAKQD